MDNGCVFRGKKLSNGYNICLARNIEVLCTGMDDYKKTCPEWGPTREAEKYYEKKLLLETD
ncbi:MAG: hypothetical protein EHM20_15010 [Alphaproteobacteria bacterium]|nr:MAG: hypothetical protein EHM20_15010 [Alphaproteobacteria bacterium]